MPRYGMLVDLTKCAGCAACTVACQAQNQLYSTEHWVRVQTEERGQYPAVTRQFLTVQCMHCGRPTCVSVCPTGASYKRRDGIVLVDYNRCIGCKYCVVACPYQARTFIEERGIPEKCRFCLERIEKGVKPACVLACVGKARYFGDLEDPDSEISKLVVERKASQLRADIGNDPSIFYVRG